MPFVHRDVIVVGASAGGVEALCALVGSLPADLAATVLVVLHMPVGGESALPSILRRSGRLPVTAASDGDPLRHAHVSTAVPDRHLLVVGDQLTLSRGPTENGYRPAVDALFRSAARALGPRCIGVVLSGALDDGTAGLISIVARGGVAVVQDPSDALCPSMPLSAMREVATKHVCPVSEMGKVLTTLVREPVDTDCAPPLPPMTAMEALLAEHGEWEADYEVAASGTPSGFSCPDCQGSLYALEDTGRYRCRVGHAWTGDALLEQKSSELESALWTALRTLDEKTTLSRRMREGALERRSPLIAARYGDSAEEAQHAARILRAFLRAGGPRRRDES